MKKPLNKSQVLDEISKAIDRLEKKYKVVIPYNVESKAKIKGKKR